MLLMDSESIPGAMEEDTKEISETTFVTVTESTPGLTVPSTKASTRTT